MGPSPLEENLRVLTDEIGGRVPGTEANRRGVAWGVEAFRQAGVDSVRTEKFTMPASWSEGETRLEVLAPQHFAARAVSIAWSPATPGGGIEAAVINIGDGTEAEFARAGSAAKGALLLVRSDLLRTWADLFNEYMRAPAIIDRAVKAGAAGILWTSSREQGLLYRHINSSMDASTAWCRRWWRAKMRSVSRASLRQASQCARGSRCPIAPAGRSKSRT